MGKSQIRNLVLDRQEGVRHPRKEPSQSRDLGSILRNAQTRRVNQRQLHPPHHNTTRENLSVISTIARNPP